MLRRKEEPAIALKDLPRVDIVLLSHNHYDHLDARTVLDRKVADKRVFPSIDILKSGTRKEDLLIDKVDLQKTFVLRTAHLTPNKPERDRY